jgi:chaperone BCS1
MDKKVELGVADNKMTTDLFCVVFKPTEGDPALLKHASSDVLVHVAAGSLREEVERVELLAQEFADRVPELKFSPAEILSFLLKHRKSPEETIDNVGQLISKPIKARFKTVNKVYVFNGV